MGGSTSPDPDNHDGSRWHSRGSLAPRSTMMIDFKEISPTIHLLGLGFLINFGDFHRFGFRIS
jgi:hypothetical protein